MTSNGNNYNAYSQQPYDSSSMAYDRNSYGGNGQHNAAPYQQGYQSWQSEDQSYAGAHSGTAQPNQPSQQHMTQQRPQYPYRPRPSPGIGRGDGATRFCEHGASFDCGYGCHTNSPQTTTPSPQNNPSPYYSPSSGYAGSPQTGQTSAPSYANLPYRMPPGPTMDSTYGTNQNVPDPATFNYPQGGFPVQTSPSGQQRAGYASLPARMTEGQMTEPTSEATHRAQRRT